MQKLFSTFIQDAYRSYCTKRFVFAVLGVAFFNFLSVYWDMLLGSDNCVAYLYMISGIMGIETLYLLLSVLPGTILFRVDKNENYQRNVLLRSGKIAYLLSKVVITVFTAISVSLIGDFLFICALEMRYPFTTDEFSEQVLSLYGCSVLEKVLLNQYLHLYFRVWRCIYHPELKIYLLFYFPRLFYIICGCVYAGYWGYLNGSILLY